VGFLPLVLFGGFAETFLGGAHSTEGGYKGTILAAQYEDIWIRLVQEVTCLEPEERSTRTFSRVHVVSTSSNHPIT